MLTRPCTAQVGLYDRFLTGYQQAAVDTEIVSSQLNAGQVWMSEDLLSFTRLQALGSWGCMCMRGCVLPQSQLPGQHRAEEASRILARRACVDDGSSLKGTLATQDKAFAPGSGVKSTSVCIVQCL